MLKKDELITRQTIVHSCLISINQVKKELCVDNKVQDTIGDVYCPTCISQKCVYIASNRTSSFYDCKNCKTLCHVLNIPFKDQKPTISKSGGNGTPCFVNKLSRDNKNEKPSPFLKKFLHQSQSTTPEPEARRHETFHLWHNCVDFTLVNTVNQKVFSSLFLYTFSLQ